MQIQRRLDVAIIKRVDTKLKNVQVGGKGYILYWRPPTSDVGSDVDHGVVLVQ
jgi:hypothetical protein